MNLMGNDKILLEIRKNLDEDIKKKKNDFTTERMDMSIGEIVNLYQSEELIISPDFQRLFRWSKYQQTRLIESLLLGIPIPPIFVVQNENGVWELVDGLQRLSTVISFIGHLKGHEGNFWKLKEGDLIKTFKGMTFEDLSTASKISIKRYILRIEIISSNSDPNIRYELFNRLNTGGSKLSPQEIRNVIYRGVSTKFNEFLRNKAEDPKFLEIINISESKQKSLYADELVLRFCALYNNDEIKQILGTYLNKYMLDMVTKTKDDDSILQDLGYIFDKTVRLLYELKNSEIFIPLSGKGGFSSSLYDGIMIGLAQNLDLYERNPKLLNEKITELKNAYDTDKEKFTGTQAHNPQKVLKRIETANDIFEKTD